MPLLVEQNKSSNEQLLLFKDILLQSERMNKILKTLDASNLKNYYVVAGCINQTIFNYYHGFDLNYGIKDIDIVYFDDTIDSNTEKEIAKDINKIFDGEDIEFDIINEASVHLWFKSDFGYDIVPYKNLEDAISRWGATITCIGVRLNDDELEIYAPYGVDDILNLIIRPTKEDFNEEHYYQRAQKWTKKWPNLITIPWDK